MKRLIQLTAAAIIAQLAHAGDFSFAFEGSAEQRERLSKLQGSSDLPALEVTGWENSEPLELKDLKGKIIVLDFWATWCGPCLKSIPANNEIHEKYKDQVVFIGICHPRGSEKMKGVIKNKGIKFPVAIDTDEKTSDAYHVNGYPDYFIIDQNGVLVVADCANDKVGEVLEKLLKK